MLELACDMDLPKGGELWQDLREERLPFEFTGGNFIIKCTQVSTLPDCFDFY